MKTKRISQLKKFEASIAYEYKNIELLDIAFTHSSYINEHNDSPKHNERLEFLGDSVVNLIVTDILFREHEDLPEGDLTRIRASLICEDSFAWASEFMDIPNYILLGKGEELSGGRKRKSLMADSFEAFCGSLYLDSNFETLQKVLTNKFQGRVVEYIKNHKVIDYKTMLQEEVQKISRERIKYHLIKDIGPDHNKVFYFEVVMGTKVLGKGKGQSKKEAEHMAAKDALEKMSIINE